MIGVQRAEISKLNLHKNEILDKLALDLKILQCEKQERKPEFSQSLLELKYQIQNISTHHEVEKSGLWGQ